MNALFDDKMLEWVKLGMPDMCCGCGHQTAMHSMYGDCTVDDCHSVHADENAPEVKIEIS